MKWGMERIGDKTYFNGQHMKLYKVRTPVSIPDFAEALLAANVRVENVYVSEAADVGCRCFEGNYSLEDFLQKYKEIDHEDISAITWHISERDRIYFGGGEYLSLSTTEDIELDDIFQS